MSGAIIGLIFPLAFLASALVGAGIGAGKGALLDHHHKSETKADVEEVLPPGSSGIVALFEERWVADVEKGSRKPTRSPSTRSTAQARTTQSRPRPEAGHRLRHERCGCGGG